MSPRVVQPELGAMDRWIADQPYPKPSRADVLRPALHDWLLGIGYLKHHEPRELTPARKGRSPGDDPEVAN